MAILIAVLYIHMDMGRKWAIRKVIAQLHSWISLNGIIRDIVPTGTAGNNKFWRASYTFRLNETEYTGKARCNTVRGGSAPYYSSQQVCLLVDPDNPEHCRLKNDMRSHSFMLIKSDDLKSIKRVRIEFVIDCLVALASAAGIFVLDIVYSYTHGAAVLFYLIVA